MNRMSAAPEPEHQSLGRNIPCRRRGAASVITGKRYFCRKEILCLLCRFGVVAGLVPAVPVKH